MKKLLLFFKIIISTLEFYNCFNISCYFFYSAEKLSVFFCKKTTFSFFQSIKNQMIQKKYAIFNKTWRKNDYLCILKFRGVAQLASALAWGARGRKFESFHPDFFLQFHTYNAIF